MTASAPILEPLWTGYAGKDRPLRFFSPPGGEIGAFPYVAAADLISLLSPFSQAFDAFQQAMREEDEDLGSITVTTEDGPLLLLPHPSARALLSASMDDGAPMGPKIEAYMSAVETALVVYLTPMTKPVRDAWVTAFQAAYARDTDGGEA